MAITMARSHRDWCKRVRFLLSDILFYTYLCVLAEPRSMGRSQEGHCANIRPSEQVARRAIPLWRISSHGQWEAGLDCDHQRTVVGLLVSSIYCNYAASGFFFGLTYCVGS